jgi:hypothetical protein
MQLANDIKNEVRAAKKMRLPWWGVLIGIIGSFLCAWLFDQFGRLNIALPTLSCIAVLGFLIALKWKLRRQVWFWIAMTIIAALHVPLILFVPWTTKWVPAMAIAAIDSADFIVLLAVLSVVEKSMEGPNTSERRAAPRDS